MLRRTPAMVHRRPRQTAAFCVSLGGLLASADSAPRVGFGFGIRDAFQRRLVGIFSGFLFFPIDFLLFGARSGASAATLASHTSHASHASRVRSFLCNS